MRNRIKILFIVVGLVTGSLLTISATLLISGNSSEGKELHADEHEQEDNMEIHEEHSEHEDIVKLDDNVIDETGIEISTAGAVEIKETVHLTAKITTIPENIAHIIPRYEGLVKNVLKQPGDRVEKGEVLAIIESNESLMNYEVKSSIEGTIVDIHLTPGEYATGEEHAIEIAKLDEVWAEIAVYEKDLHKVKKGQKVVLKSLFTEDEYSGIIFYRSPLVNEDTRAGLARVLVENSKGFWMPGMFLTADVTVDEKKVNLGIERTALHNYEGDQVVFIQNEEGIKPSAVKTGTADDSYVQILSGLTKGDKYVSKGAFVIKSELMKESFGGGHNH